MRKLLRAAVHPQRPRLERPLSVDHRGRAAQSEHFLRDRRRGRAARRRRQFRFQRPASRKHDDEVQFYAFDILVSDGEDVRKLPLSMRKTNLARLLARRVDGIFLSDFEQGEIGPDLFRHACLMGLEGMVSKHRDRPYRAGRSPHWIKVKNRKHPAFSRVLDQGSSPTMSTASGVTVMSRWICPTARLI